LGSDSTTGGRFAVVPDEPLLEPLEVEPPEEPLPEVVELLELELLVEPVLVLELAVVAVDPLELAPVLVLELVVPVVLAAPLLLPLLAFEPPQPAAKSAAAASAGSRFLNPIEFLRDAADDLRRIAEGPYSSGDTSSMNHFPNFRPRLTPLGR
jgi:hypothetical protein